MKAFRRIACLVFALAICLSLLAIPVSAADNSKALAEVKKGVVQLLAIAYAGDKNSAQPVDACSGTGFAVGKKGTDASIFVTNWHVATCMGYDPGRVRVYLLLDDWYLDENLVPKNAVECEILYTTADNGGTPDYAILRATESVTGFKPLTFRPSDEVTSGTPVYALGYPVAITDLNSTIGSGIDDITITSGIISQHMEMAKDNSQTENILVHDAQISAGNSGGPLVDAKGRVIGVNTYNYSTMSYSMAVNTKYITERLDLLGLPYTMETSRDAATHTAVYILLGVVIVAGAVTLILVLNKSKKAKKADSGIWLKAPNGSLIAITAKPMTIGRLSDCQIRLPDDTKGVSRHHCTVCQQNGMVVLTDIGSSGGTFVGGTRLSLNVPVTITKGTTFCLGSPSSNPFTIC